ncbi:hypothetical protein HYH02_007922 [Chlamydomonas schloesseri]|uniref:Protein farnesyltransferase/geranylgeranyltransferase type-1 subunit alpha n=1 Tax=Chlamydomonas schloesseri TaxID=2026947 RepID=A0A835WGI0_9CHLO|nr:hypothetical protein HYH02_007922 [Chlamydomonas schloesseri]|eukprot:KAG2447179.1 hypothetical protein HYH02_007922 [Chlamydomonas schloesseri]
MSAGGSGGGSGPLPYSKRPEWQDVTPVSLPAPEKVVAIQYSAEHAEALGYWRAVLQSGELSPRVLALTGDMIRLNQADYTAWRVRWLCVQRLGPEALPAELDFTHAVMLENAKNYQLWNHRRLVAGAIGPSCAQREDAFTREAIIFDEKNYHAWAHRQAIVKITGLWAAELAFADEFIGRDVRNNTAWNQRMFVWRSMGRPARLQLQGGGDDTVWLRSELEYIAAAIQKAPRNESPWRYLTGLFAGLEPWAGSPHALSRVAEVHTLCCEALHDCSSCGPAYDVLAQFYEGQAALAAAQAGAAEAAAQAAGTAGEGAVAERVAAAMTACEVAQAALDEAGVADPMRTPYWFHRQRGLNSVLASATARLH